MLEAGDAVSDGAINPAVLVRLKGIGEGRRQFIDLFNDALVNSGIKANRRNLEVLARGLINHVKITDPNGFDGFLVDDIVSYDDVKYRYNPREGVQKLKLDRAKGKYLERPVLHYTLGTRLTPSVIKQMKDHGVNEVEAHDDAPPFEPIMIRGMESAMRDKNWMTRMYGSFLSKGFLEAVHRGRTAPIKSTSFVPGFAVGEGFGEDLEEKGVY